MPAFKTGTVTTLLSERKGLQRVEVDGEAAYVLTELIGPVAVGDRVVVNTTAVDLSLGSGGWHVVHWNLSRSDVRIPGGGHIMKLRYTSLQADVGAAEEDSGELPLSLGGMPVVVCTVHSQLACVAVAFKAWAPRGARLAYVMTDGAGLALPLSDLVADLVEAGLLDVTVTAGHAFGGDFEAVNVPSALSVARHSAGCDAVVVAMGPGVVGTGTTLGTTALEAAPALDAVAALDGTPILALRASGAELRARHRGVSHHSSTVLRLTRSPVTVPVPPGVDFQAARHQVETVDVPNVPALLSAHKLSVTSMGRGPEADPLFYAAAGAAGAVAARRLPRSGTGSGPGSRSGAP